MCYLAGTLTGFAIGTAMSLWLGPCETKDALFFAGMATIVNALTIISP